jgi:hypothetical protein
MRGEAFKKTFKFIPATVATVPTIDYADSFQERCTFELPVIADSATSDTFKNDTTSVYFGYSSIVNTVDLELYKCDELQAPLNANTYGTFYALGFHTDGIKNYIGFKINWKLVMAAFGVGEYYVKSTANLITGQTFEEYSLTYCLKQYTQTNVDGTVRIEFTHNGIIGDYKIDKDSKSFEGLQWYNSIRLPEAMVYNERSEFESEQIQYTNGMMQDTKLEQTPKYDLICGLLPNEIHRFIRTEVVTSDNIIITDYNGVSPLRPFVNKELKFTGNYEPNWQGLSNKSSVLIGFEQRYNNLRKRFC